MPTNGKRMVTITNDDQRSKLLVLSEEQIALLKWLSDNEYFYDEIHYEVQNEIIDPCEVKR